MIDKEVLLKARLPEGEVEVEGGTIRVRALSRTEVMQFKTLADKGDHDAVEHFILSKGVLEPALSDKELRTWRGVAVALEIEPVLNRILELSGLVGADARFPDGTESDAG